MRGKLAASGDEPWDMTKALRSGTLPKWTPPALRQVQTWVETLSEGGSPFLTVTGPSSLLRAEVYQVCYAIPGLQVYGSSRNPQDWLIKGVLDDITQKVRAITGRPWGLIWDLLDVKDFIVEEPLRSLIDQGISLTGFFKAIWEARFLLQEGKKPETLALVGALIRWLCAQDLNPEQQTQLEKVPIDRELGSLQERLDMMLFLLALAYQNGVVDRTVLVFDGLDRLVKSNIDKRKDLFRQFADATTTVQRWSRLGSATGLVFGLDTTGGTLEALGQYNERLGKTIVSSLV